MVHTSKPTTLAHNSGTSTTHNHHDRYQPKPKPTFQAIQLPSNYVSNDQSAAADQIRAKWLSTQPLPGHPHVSLAHCFKQAVWIARAVRLASKLAEAFDTVSLEERSKTDEAAARLHMLLAAIERALGTFSVDLGKINTHLLDYGSYPEIHLDTVFNGELDALHNKTVLKLDKPLTELSPDAIPTWGKDVMTVLAMLLKNIHSDVLTSIRPSLSASYAHLVYALYEGTLDGMKHYAADHPEWAKEMKARKIAASKL